MSLTEYGKLVRTAPVDAGITMQIAVITRLPSLTPAAAEALQKVSGVPVSNRRSPSECCT